MAVKRPKTSAQILSLLQAVAKRNRDGIIRIVIPSNVPPERVELYCRKMTERALKDHNQYPTGRDENGTKICYAMMPYFETADQWVEYAQWWAQREVN